MSTTYLYEKQCLHCGLKYFGKTIRDPNTYRGSGTHWLRHLRKHKAKVKTVSIWSFDDLNECNQFALNFSKSKTITQSREWANMKDETGLDGGMFAVGWNHTEEAREKISVATTGRKRGPMSEEHKRKLSEALKGRKLSAETRRKQSESKRGHTVSDETRKKLSDAWYRNRIKTCGF